MLVHLDLEGVSPAAAGIVLNSGRTAAVAAPWMMSRRLTASTGAPNRRGGVLLALKAYLRTDNTNCCHSPVRSDGVR